MQNPNSKFHLSVVLAALLYSGANAQVMYLDNTYYRDFLDLAQNKGIFSDINQQVTLKQKNGESFVFDKIPDQSARSNHGSITSLGRNYVVTARHIYRTFMSTNMDEKKGKFGNTTYHYLSGWENGRENPNTNTIEQYGRDTIFLRTDKYIVEGNIDPLDATGVTALKDISTEEAAIKNINALKSYLQAIADSNGEIEAYQAGTGTLGVKIGDIYPILDFENDTSGGSLIDIKTGDNFIRFQGNGAHDANMGLKNGIIIATNANKKFTNVLSTGDSGSGLFIYDDQKKKWVLIGVLSKGSLNGYAEFSVVSKADFDDYKKNYENKLSGSSISKDDLKADKDNIINTNATINFNETLDLNSGGLVFTNGTSTINGNGTISELAGIDVVGENTKVALGVKVTDTLHKIGAGELIVTNQNENLKLGDGTVTLSNGGSFEKIYLTSGRGTLKLDNNENLNNKIFFGNGGGKLDLNGKNQTFDTISANANNAKIINSNSATSNLTINGESGKNTIFHASIGGTDNNKINIEKTSNNTLIFDGGFDISGKVNLKGGTTVLQGHPTTHAIGDIQTTSNPGLHKGEQYANQQNRDIIKKLENSPMDLTRPSTLSQPDWDERDYKASAGIELSGAKLHIGKNAKVTADITANSGSEVVFGGSNMRHYIDKLDGANTTGDGFSYNQEVSSGIASGINDDTISFTGAITADSSTITSHIKNFNPTSINLKNNSTLKADEISINSNSVNIQKDTTSSIEANKLTISNISNDFDLDKIAQNSAIKNINLDNSTATSSDLGKSLQNLNLNSSNLSLQGNFTITNAIFNLDDASTLSSDNFALNNSNLSIHNSIKSNLGIFKNLNLTSSQLKIDNYAFKNTDSITGDTNSLLTFDTLTYDMANKPTIDANIAIANLIDIQNANTKIADQFQAQTPAQDLDFKKALNLQNGANIKMDLSGLALSEANLDKNYEVISAQTMLKGEVNTLNFDIKDPSGYFTQFDFADNKLSVKFTKQNLNDTNEIAKKGQITDTKDKQILNMLSKVDQDLIQNAARTDDFTALKAKVQKIDKDFETMAANTNVISTRALYANNNIINSRISQLNHLRADISQFKLASVDSDFATNLGLVLDAMETQEYRNNFWANVNGGYFNENSTDGDIKFYGTNFGYDKRLSGTNLTLGAMFGIGQSKYQANSFEEKANIYNFGVYSLYDGEKFEVQNNLNFAFIRGDRSISNSKDTKVETTGVLSSNYFKYKIDLDSSLELRKTFKPILAVELGANGIDDFDNGIYKQKGFNDFNIAVGAGGAYEVSSKDWLYSVQALAYTSLYNSKDQAFVALNNSDQYIGYDITQNDLSFKLNLLGQNKLSEALDISYEVGAMVDNDKNYGLNGSIRFGYKF